MDRITDNVEPVPGNFYLVNCAKIKYEDGSVFLIPVIGEPHRDPQFGGLGKFKHYHIDGRFVPQELAGYFFEDGRTNQVIITENHPEYKPAHRYQFLGVELRRRKCRRTETGLLFKKFGLMPDKWYAWKESMVGKSCKDRICPHFGTKMVEVDGKWICPIHNLVGCPKTEKITDETNYK